ncbi:ABC transporter substrate-binding protein [Alcaligenaceae bacterium]|nr:ABC transporter substrate-binding protein [Alcaligenaceae bacterium]
MFILSAFRKAALLGVLFLFATSCVRANTLTVTHWGSGMYGLPFAIALDKGFFKDAGVDVTGFITSAGGGTTVRNAMASDIPYGEVALPAALAAIKQGVKLTIVHAGVVSLADNVWVATKDSPLSSIEDLKGKNLGYSSPRSVTDMVSTVALSEKGMLDEVKRTAVGSTSSALTALREGGVDVIYMIEPALSSHMDSLKIVFRSSEALPQMTQTVGVVRSDYLEKNGKIIEAIIEGRRRGVEYLTQHPEEAAESLARHYKLDPAVAKSAVDSVLADKAPYWSDGRLDYDGMEAMLRGLVMVKAIDEGPFDWKTVVDERFLPAELRGK